MPVRQFYSLDWLTGTVMRSDIKNQSIQWGGQMESSNSIGNLPRPMPVSPLDDGPFRRQEGRAPVTAGQFGDTGDGLPPGPFAFSQRRNAPPERGIWLNWLATRFGGRA